MENSAKFIRGEYQRQYLGAEFLLSETHLKILALLSLINADLIVSGRAL